MKKSLPAFSLKPTNFLKAISFIFITLFSNPAFSQPCTPPTVDAPTVSQPTCAVPSGAIIIFASGVSTLEYSLDGTTWQLSNSFSGLATGSYNISVRLQSNPACISTFSGNPVKINILPVPPTVNPPTVTQPTCALPSGKIVVNATGVGTLEYSLNGGTWQFSNTFSGLAPGSYNISVRLQTNPTCVTAYSGNPVIIDAVPVPPTVNAPTVTQPTCAVPSGTIVVNATGAGTLEYSDDGGSTWQSSNTFSGLTPGNYNLSVRLQSSTTCVTVYSANPVVINAVPVPPVVNAPTVTQPTCAVPSGSIVVNATGAGTLEYSDDGGTTWQVSNTFSGLAPGNYNISVRLQSSPTCVTAYSGNPVIINAVPIPPVVNAPTVTQPTCAIPTGTIVVNATGAGTLEYSLDGTTWQLSNTFSGLTPGNYNISVRLQSSPTCVKVYSGNPVVINAVPVPPTVNAPTVTQPTCTVPTGTIVVNATGVGTLEYSLDGITWQTSNTFSGLATGNYSISVRLQSSPTCVTSYSSNPVFINIPPLTPTVNPVSNQTLCTNTSTTAVTFSGTPGGVVFNWTNNTTSIGLAASGSGDIASFTAINNGTTTVTATITVTPSFTNAGGTCTGTPITFTINVQPTPTITCPGNKAANVAPGLCGAVVNYTTSSTGTPVITYSFSGATTGSGSGDGSGSVFNVGTTVVTVTATNTCNVATCSFNVVVTDNEPPVITCPANITLNNEPTICGAFLNYILPSVTDNCSLPGGSLVQTAGLATGSTFPVGTTTNTYVATDAAGNTSTCSFTVTVRDIEPPSITCPANIVQCDNHIVTFALPAATDNCSATVAASPASGSNFPTGTSVVTLTATDPAGNKTTCTFNVTINLTPTVNPVANQTICDGGTATFTATASGTPAPTYQWQIDQGSGFVNLTNTLPFSGVTTATLTITGGTTAYNGNSIRVVVTNSCGSTNSNAATLTVNPLPTINVTPNGSCAPVLLTATGANTYTWSPATGLSATTGASVTASPTATTTYTVTGTVTATGCQNTTTVNVLGYSSSSVLSGTTGICPAGSANLIVTITGGVSPYTVVYSNGTTNFTVNGYTSGANIPVTPASTTTYTLVSVTGANGCSGAGLSGTAIITVNPAPTISVGPNNQCGPVTLTATGTSTTYTWSPAAGLNATTGATVIANPTVNTTYTVIGTITATGCQNSAIVNVNYTPVAPTITPASINLCVGATTSLTASNVVSAAVWTPVTGLYTNAAATIPYIAGTQLNTVYAKPATNTTYSATTSTATCTSPAATVTVNVFQAISITTQPVSQTVCAGANVSFSVVTPGAALPSGNFQSYQWQVKVGAGAFTNVPGANNPTLVLPAVTTALSTNQYQVIITNGCFTVTSNPATLTVNPTPTVTTVALINRMCISDTITIPLSATPAGGTWSGIGVSGSNFTPSATSVGTYTLTYTYTNGSGCTATGTVIAKVEDCQERIIRLRDDAVILWPNPNNGRFFIRIHSTLYNYLGMRVYTSHGALVRIQNFGGLVYGRVIPIDLTNLPADVYMVEFYYDAAGPRTSNKTFKVVVGSH